MLKAFLRKNTPSFGLRWLHKAGMVKSFEPEVGKVALGDFNRLIPFSFEFGYDRGGPIDRYYIENFLEKEAAHIKGRVLEIGDNSYTLKYGANKVERSDILHINENNPNATIIGDLANIPQVKDNTFDCIVLTQTLHLIYHFQEALQTCHRILKPGGALLLTSPVITPIDYSDHWNETWYWSFTDKAFKKLMAEAFPSGNVDIQTFGNVFSATAFLYGMGLQEISKQQLDHVDPQYQVIVTVKAVKAG